MIKVYPLYGCNTQAEGYKPREAKFTIQDGWTADGRRNMIEYPDYMSKECRYDRFMIDKKCSGCGNKPDKVYKPE